MAACMLVGGQCQLPPQGTLKCMAQVRLQGRQHITTAGDCMHVQQDVQGQPRLPAIDNAVGEPPGKQVCC